MNKQRRNTLNKKIAELENEISVNQNVMDAQNDSINRLRRSLEKRKKGGQPNG
jgi:predicted  nucleic acid-binding Zn-ribbon protein